jgi:hypothetical protein
LPTTSGGLHIETGFEDRIGDAITDVLEHVAEELGDLAENTIGKVWVRKENARLARRLNESIRKNRDDLRWSMASWFGQLGGPANTTP